MKIKRPWYDIDDRYFIGWFVAMAIAGVIGNPRGFGGFVAGLNAGFALQKFFDLKFRRMVEAHRRQDKIDIRTLQDIVHTTTYKTLHQMEKSGWN